MRSSPSNTNSFPPIHTNTRRNDNVWMNLAFELAKFGLTIYVTTKAVSILKKKFDADHGMSSASNAKKRSLAKRLNRPDVETMEFTSYELRLMDDVVGMDELNVSFDDIGGLGRELDEVKDNVVLPMQMHNNVIGYGDLVPPFPTGILLYGLPGTGKTLIAKAIAKEAGATFISVKASDLLHKWFGESDRLVSALFSLGRKLSPSVIFIDEIDTVLKSRHAIQSHPATASMQGVFLAEWDGLTINPNKSEEPVQSRPGGTTAVVVKPHGPVVVLGATNRPNDLDPAFLRRMPVKIQTHMPDEQGRLEILKVQLKGEEQVTLDLQHIASQTTGFSGSDLRELVRIAQLQRAKEMTVSLRSSLISNKQDGVKKSHGGANSQELPLPTITKRLLLDTDFEVALIKAKDTVGKTTSFNESVAKADGEHMLVTCSI